MTKSITDGTKWVFQLEQEEGRKTEVGQLESLPVARTKFSREVDEILVTVQIEPRDGMVNFKMEASSESDHRCILSLKSEATNQGLYSYDEKIPSRQVFRQSPHDPVNCDIGALRQQAVPMFAWKTGEGFIVAVNDTPALYDNFTTQTLDPSLGEAVLSSGDTGEITGKAPKSVVIQKHYPELGKGRNLAFNGIIFNSSAGELNELRRDVLFAIARRWGGNATDRLGATAFASNYMLVRRNETGRSRYWVVAGIEYSNKAYTRDSFWQSMVLPVEYAAQCYQNEALSQPVGAERPLFSLIWAYRNQLQGQEVNLVSARKTLDYIEAHSREGWYYSSNDKKLKSFQSWYDLVAFEEDDVISYNQGLYAVALLSAEALGFKLATPPALAIGNYQALFDVQGGYFPLSRKKNLLAVDPLAGDLLAQLFFDKALLPDESVRSHFNRVMAHAKTEYGFKVTCLPDGSYAPTEDYSAKDFKVNFVEKGDYQWGGSWTLYDMLCLIDCHLHGAPGALAALIWRGTLDFKIGGTYFEHINTVSGRPDKANQGWNAAIYAIWRRLMEQGKVDGSLLNAINEASPAKPGAHSSY
ncbi:MAG: hypothetical protein WCS31_12835 [Verrucomicrobiae bacterium]